eukprot:1156250-Pelagomonas_calceolata.AAC.2
MEHEMIINGCFSWPPLRLAMFNMEVPVESVESVCCFPGVPLSLLPHHEVWHDAMCAIRASAMPSGTCLQGKLYLKPNESHNLPILHRHPLQ